MKGVMLSKALDKDRKQKYAKAIWKRWMKTNRRRSLEANSTHSEIE
jgi:hypothetical protein